ncbi:MAG: sigma 54-interacting transcriptional regulator, partial [Pseudomonadota bacterium]
DGGTLFLDEIGELDFSLQSKLLRFLQTGQIKKVGAELDEKVDVRIICATNRDPLEDIAAGRFREDLYYRLHVVPIHLPPLRDRLPDVEPLLEHFLAVYGQEEAKSFNGFTPEARYRMMQYPWPGNIRELQNTVRHIAVMAPGGMVDVTALPAAIQHGQNDPYNTPSPAPHHHGHHAPTAPPGAGHLGSAPSGSAAPTMPLFDQAPGQHTTPQAGFGSGATSGLGASQTMGGTPTGIEPLWQVEKRTIESAIAQCDGNISMAARLLEISPSTIYRKREQWEKQGV